MGLKQTEMASSVFEDPQVSERWSRLVEWLDRYGAYWREEGLGLVTHVELLVSAALRAAERGGLDRGRLHEGFAREFGLCCYLTVLSRGSLKVTS
jgi:hypothetical protein